MTLLPGASEPVPSDAAGVQLEDEDDQGEALALANADLDATHIAFAWHLAGEELIHRYESSPGSFRAFCGVCSSLVPGQAPYLETMSIPAGLLDDDPEVRPRLHVFTSSKAPWWNITDDLPQHAKWVPGYEPKQS